MVVAHLLLAPLALAGPPASGGGDAPVDFSRDVAPLLSDRCFKCHGPDEGSRKAGLRLDVREAALAPAKSGNVAIVPGDADASELVARITATNPRKRMPPASSGKELSDAERATLVRWIEQGAKWSGHWAWQAPRSSKLPELRDANDEAWCREPLDRFVMARLEREGLAPSPEADAITLLRRATLALTGLPPTIEEVDAFVAEAERDRDGAYARAVDRLLASPHYGERMALPWLDAARYADSNGFQQDGDTYQWVWRDWLVRAVNDDVPQDRLATLLLAGDLLPAATPEQRLDQQLASALQRCHLLNGEGGAIAEEQRNVIVFDRVDLFATAFLGLTAACAQCHDHKYDPITQRDYYSLFAFFNQVPESGVPPGGGQYRIAEPAIRCGTPKQNQQLIALDAALADADAAVAREEAEPAVVAAKQEFEQRRRDALAQLDRGAWESAAPIAAASYDAAFALEPAAIDAATWAARSDLGDGVVHPLAGDATAFFLRRTLKLRAPLELLLRFGSDDAIRVRIDGATMLERKVTRGAAPDQERVAIALDAGDHELLLQIVNGAGPGGFWFDLSLGGSLADFAPPPALAAARERQRSARAERDALRDSLPQVMVMSDAQPRATHVLARGNYEAPLAAVDAAPPAFLPPLPDGAPRDRLGLAQWLVAPENPLFARVLVNRAWQHFFGVGLVKTAENFGVQGEAPSHAELLDTLAVELRTNGHWSMKALHRSIVTSATFRQSSRTAGPRGVALRERDPVNRLLARGPRQRLPSLLLRDVALSASGLLDARVGGAPVYPYQPAGIWDGLAITKERDFAYPQSRGADLWRRSLYTFWRRTAAPGNMFDASDRQTCKVRLAVTSTPLHALTMQDDATWVEAARALAQRAMAEERTLDTRLARAFRRVCARRPNDDEVALLRRTVERARAAFAADRDAAARLLAVGESARDASLDPLDHAALTVACLTLLNLDEAMTCE